MRRKDPGRTKIANQFQALEIACQAATAGCRNDHSGSFDNKITRKDRPTALIEETGVVRCMARRVNNPQLAIAGVHVLAIAERVPLDTEPSITFRPQDLGELHAGPPRRQRTTAGCVVRMTMGHKDAGQLRPVQRLTERIDLTNVPCSSVDKRRRAATDQIRRVARTRVRPRIETWDRSDRHEVAQSRWSPLGRLGRLDGVSKTNKNSDQRLTRS